MAKPGPDRIRALRAENPKARARDFAAQHGITEADLVAAFLGETATAIVADPDRLMPWAVRLGEVMALTRNESCVHERVGSYLDYRTGAFASMILGPEIDLRIFGKHWVHAFALEEAGEDGPKRSLQVFDAAGDAVHKVHLKPQSNHALWPDLIANMRLADQSAALDLPPRRPVDPAKGDSTGAPALRAAWDRMTDTHQFIGMTKDQGMNRLGAYRVAGAPYVERLQPEAVTHTLAEIVAMGREAGDFATRPEVDRLALSAVGLLDREGDDFRTLSGGERQRGHLARALAQVWEPVGPDGPRWLMLDEPVASLDLGHQLKVMRLARSFADAGGGVLAIMHDLNLSAMFADRMAFLVDGRLAALGPPAEVMTEPLLERAYGCAVALDRVPSSGPWLLPQNCGPGGVGSSGRTALQS